MQYFEANNNKVFKKIGQTDSQEVYQDIITDELWLCNLGEFNPLRQIHNEFDCQYLELTSLILRKGLNKGDRTGTGTRSLTGHSFKIDISKNFPLLTVKKTFYNSILNELIWFINGSTYTANLDTDIWCENTTRDFLDKRGLEYPEGYGGPMYGRQWRGKSHAKIMRLTNLDRFQQFIGQQDINKVVKRDAHGYKIINPALKYAFFDEHPEEFIIQDEMNWDDTTHTYSECGTQGIDQIQRVIYDIKNNPNSRRIIMSNWDVNNIDNMALPPCHLLFQVVVNNGVLDCTMYQRSADLFLGVPFNIASYSTLVYILANLTGTKPGSLTVSFGDVHIYSNHIDKAEKILNKKIFDAPTLTIQGQLDINNLRETQFILNNYNSGIYIKAKMAV